MHARTTAQERGAATTTSDCVQPIGSLARGRFPRVLFANFGSAGWAGLGKGDVRVEVVDSFTAAWLIIRMSTTKRWMFMDSEIWMLREPMIGSAIAGGYHTPAQISMKRRQGKSDMSL